MYLLSQDKKISAFETLHEEEIVKALNSVMG